MKRRTFVKSLASLAIAPSIAPSIAPASNPIDATGFAQALADYQAAVLRDVATGLDVPFDLLQVQAASQKLLTYRPNEKTNKPSKPTEWSNPGKITIDRSTGPASGDPAGSPGTPGPGPGMADRDNPGQNLSGSPRRTGIFPDPNPGPGLPGRQDRKR